MLGTVIRSNLAFTRMNSVDVSSFATPWVLTSINEDRVVYVHLILQVTLVIYQYFGTCLTIFSNSVPNNCLQIIF